MTKAVLPDAVAARLARARRWRRRYYTTAEQHNSTGKTSAWQSGGDAPYGVADDVSVTPSCKH